MNATVGPTGVPSHAPVRYRFAACALDLATRELSVAGRRVDVQPLVFDLLVYLIEHRDRTVDKDELLDVLWRGTVVTEASLTQAIRKARAVVGDTGDSQRIIRTMTRRGYRFVAPLELDSQHVAAGTASTSAVASVAPDAPRTGSRSSSSSC